MADETNARARLVAAQKARYEGEEAAGLVAEPEPAPAPVRPVARALEPAKGAAPPRPGAWAKPSPPPPVVAGVAEPASPAPVEAKVTSPATGNNAAGVPQVSGAPPRPGAWSSSTAPGLAGAGETGPSGFVPAPPRVREGKAGKQVSLYDPAGASASLGNREEMSNRPLQDYIIGSGYVGQVLETPETLIAAEEPRWYETVFSWFEPFDYPRRYLWQGVYGAAQALPNATAEGEEPTLTSETGDALRWAAGKAATWSMAAAATSVGAQGRALVARTLGWPGYDPAEALADDTGQGELADQVGQRLYDALAQGKLYARGQEHQRKVPFGLPLVDVVDKDVTTSNPMGVDVLDFAVPKDLAEQLAAAAKDPGTRQFWTMLTSDLGREATGLSLEVAIDPLWLAGPARGTKMVHEGGKVYELGRPMVAAIARAEQLGVGRADDLARAAVRMVAGTEEEMHAARALFDSALQAAEEAATSRSAEAARLVDAVKDPARHVEAAQQVARQMRDRVAQMVEEFGRSPSQVAELAEARRALARMESELAKLGVNPGAAKVYLQGMAKRASVEARALGAAGETIRRGLGFARGSRAAGAVKEAGTLAWHIPLAGETRWAFAPGAAGRTISRASQVLPGPLVRELGKTADWWKSLDTETVVQKVMARELAGKGADVLSPAEQLVYGWHVTMNSELMGALKAAPLVVVDTLAKVLGTRNLQPLLARGKVLAETQVLSPRGRHIMRVPFLGGRYLRLERVAPEVWGRYQHAVTDYFRRMGSMEQTLMNAANGLATEAKRAVDARRRIATQELPDVRARIATLESQIARAPTATVREGLAVPLQASRRRAAELEGWMRPGYDATDVLLEVGALVESGAGLLQRRPELVRIAHVVEDLVQKYTAAAGGEEVKVREALANLVRFMEGNPREFDELGERQAMLVGQLRDINLREQVQREAVQRYASAHRARTAAMRALLVRLDPEVLAVAMERVLAAAGGEPYDVAHGAFIRRILDETTGDAATSAEVLRGAAAAMGLSDPSEAVRVLAELVRRQAAGPDGAAPGRVLVDQIRKLAASLDDEHDLIGRVARGEFDLGDEADALSRILGVEFQHELARLRALVGEARWDDFKRWADDPGTGRLGVTEDFVGADAGDEAKRVAERLRHMYAQLTKAGVAKEKLDALTPEQLGKLYIKTVGAAPPVRDVAAMAPVAEGAAEDTLRLAREEYHQATAALDRAVEAERLATEAVSEAWTAAHTPLRGQGLTEAEIEAAWSRKRPVRLAAAEADLADAKRARELAESKAAPTLAALQDALGAPRGARSTRPPLADRVQLERARRSYRRARALGESMLHLTRGRSQDLRRGLEEMGVRGGKLGEFQSGELFNRRLEEVVQDALDEEEAIRRVRVTLDEILPTGDPLLGRVADEYARRVGRDLFTQARVVGPRGRLLAGRKARAAVTEARRAAAETVEATSREVASALRETERQVKAHAADAREVVTAEVREVRERLRAVRPRLVPPDASAMKQPRALEEWERRLWTDFEAATRGLTAEDQMLAAFAALRHAPDVPQDLGAVYDSLAQVYPRVMGRRLGEVPPELVPVVEELSSLVKSYEALYEKHGMSFVKSPMEMLKTWGVVDYVPHLLAPSEKLRTGQFSSGLLAAAGETRSSSTLDGLLSMDMDAARLRTLDGTIREINAGLQDVSFTLDPNMLVARYLQANRSISAKEMLLALVRGKVVRVVEADEARGLAPHLVAAEQDLVPLLRGPNLNIDVELFVRGDRSAWESQLTPDQVDGVVHRLEEWLAGVRGKRPDSAFASWVTEVPLLQQTANTEEMLFRIRAAQFRLMAANDAKAPAALFDPMARHAELVAGGLEEVRAWDRVAGEMQRVASAFLPSDVIRKVDGAALAAYYAPDSSMWRLYLPRAVAQSMVDVFEMERLEPSGPLGVVKQLGDRFNSFWKTRVTVMSIAFSARNAGSNVLTNLLDLGWHALSPRTNAIATQLAAAMPFADTFGSLKRAREVLGAPRRHGESLAEFAARRGKLVALQADGVDALLRHGIDLGDGVHRDIDEAILLLREHGVISSSFTQVADIGRLERGWSELVMAAGLGTGLDKVQHWASVAEDALVIGMSAALTGGWPVSVGKTIGAELSHFTENQARLVSFIGNLRRSGDMRLAADATARFLFDYSDLTAVQKVWVRSWIPFFTWTFKNIGLQIDMMQEAPYFYAQFNRLLLTGFPRIAEAIDADAEGRGFNPQDPSAQRVLRLRQPHTLSMVRLPIPKAWAGFDGAYFEGLGLPQEAFVEQMGMLGALADPGRYTQAARYWDERPFMRFLGQTHFLAKMLIEYASGHHSFYDRPIDKLTNGRLIDQTVNALRLWPVVGEDLAAALEESTGLVRVARMNAHTKSYDPDVIVYGVGNWLFANQPYSRVLRDASAASDLYHASLSTDTATESALGGAKLRELPRLARVMDALTGIRLTQEDADMRARVYEKRLEEASSNQLEQRGVVRPVERDAVRKR